LPFSLDNLSQNIRLLLLLLRDLVLQLDTFVFHFLQLLLELLLYIRVLVEQLDLVVIVLIEQIIQLVHFEVQVLQRNLKLPDLTVVALNTVVQPHLLLLQNRLPVPQLVSICSYLSMCPLLSNQCSLICNPVLLRLSNLFIQLLYILSDCSFLIF
jgi:hypothetical protein